MPKSNTEFWSNKLGSNRARDEKTNKELLMLGWRICIIWECSVRDKKADEIADVINSLEEWIKNGTNKYREIGSIAIR